MKKGNVTQRLLKAADQKLKYCVHCKNPDLTFRNPTVIGV